jgi:hypothetical protein
MKTVLIIRDPPSCLRWDQDFVNKLTMGFPVIALVAASPHTPPGTAPADSQHQGASIFIDCALSWIDAKLEEANKKGTCQFHTASAITF